jgi:hypothetical protein
LLGVRAQTEQRQRHERRTGQRYEGAAISE